MVEKFFESVPVIWNFVCRSAGLGFACLMWSAMTRLSGVSLMRRLVPVELLLSWGCKRGVQVHYPGAALPKHPPAGVTETSPPDGGGPIGAGVAVAVWGVLNSLVLSTSKNSICQSVLNEDEYVLTLATPGLRFGLDCIELFFPPIFFS